MSSGTSLLRPMRARDASQEHRASTPLELFFDLTFVVAVSLAASNLGREIEGQHAARGVGLFALVFFAIWWGWLNFTWFASAYDTDDWLYRLVTLVQMGGALTVAAGIPRAFAGDDFTVVTAGYVIMRVPMVCQWLRAARHDPGHRRTAQTYAAGISGVQVLWVARLALPAVLAVPSFLALVVAEMAVPIVAEWRATTTYHPGHVAERYGLFTIIVLGEGVLAAGNTVIEAIGAGEHLTALFVLAVAGLVLLSGTWWLYFATDPADDITTLPAALRWGYGHYVVFAAAAAVSAGIEVAVTAVVEPDHVSALAARLSIGLPAAVFVLAVWALLLRPKVQPVCEVVSLAAAAALLGAAFLPLPPPAGAGVEAAALAILVGYLVASRVDGSAAPAPAQEVLPSRP